jgi:ankyrin repeat protein
MLLERYKEGQTDLVFHILKEHPSIHPDDPIARDLMIYAAYYGDLAAVMALQEAGLSLMLLGANFDLNGAVFHGHLALCEYLIEQGAGVNHPLPETGETPLHAACCKPGESRFNPIVKLLLEKGANPNTPTIPKRESGSFMRDVWTKGETPLHRAAAYCDATVVKMMLAHGANKELKDISGDTALSWASWHCRPAKILHLLCYGSYRILPEQIERYTSDHGSD